ncbi:Sporulation related domain protein [Microbulbifer aggregans]|uniref:Sporulation related domain protein n=1 Tax=Microbulbifer aggregans TaxID=1769779 RepID=A0A1C9W6N8_9GAMM|nr:SPOR domain-containing protein [Microbulbifer aggregans]AOS96811.1 Sporulation related domain protein [Microbulbifer aggregans]
MRWIVLALLIANLAGFAWFRFFAEPAVETQSVGPAVEPEGARIDLVQEVPPGALAAQEPKSAPVRQSVGKRAVREQSLCTIIGPVAEAYQGEDIVERLAALQVSAELREIEMEGQMRYWVYLAPLGTRREAFRRLRELQAEGVDSYVIPKGSLTNGISFGIFSEPDRAEALATELQERGYPAQTREEPRTYLERWVVLATGGEGQLADAFWEQLQLDYPDMDRKQNLCQELESD